MSTLTRLVTRANQIRTTVDKALDNAQLLNDHGALKSFFDEWAPAIFDEHERLLWLGRREFRVVKGAIQFGGIRWFEFDKSRPKSERWKSIK